MDGVGCNNMPVLLPHGQQGGTEPTIRYTKRTVGASAAPHHPASNAGTGLDGTGSRGTGKSNSGWTSMPPGPNAQAWLVG